MVQARYSDRQLGNIEQNRGLSGMLISILIHFITFLEIRIIEIQIVSNSYQNEGALLCPSLHLTSCSDYHDLALILIGL